MKLNWNQTKPGTGETAPISQERSKDLPSKDLPSKDLPHPNVATEKPRMDREYFPDVRMGLATRRMGQPAVKPPGP
jgi:hypothetical protein